MNLLDWMLLTFSTLDLLERRDFQFARAEWLGIGMVK